MLWEIDIYPAPGQPNLLAQHVKTAACELGLSADLQVTAAVGYLIQGDLKLEQVERLARELFADPIVQRAVVLDPGESATAELTILVHVMPKPGVMDPVAQSAEAAIADLGISIEAVRTLRKFSVSNQTAEQLQRLAARILANDAIEQVIVGPLTLDRLDEGSEYQFKLITVPLNEMNNTALAKLSRDGQLSLSLEELQTIQKYFRELGRDPTDAELETIAQTWSEHCSHKTLAGRIAYNGPLAAKDHRVGQHYYENMLAETIFAATQSIRAAWKGNGQEDWCVSVFEDHAGIVRFDDQHHLCFKVETHNHPSAIEPYGGAGTGIGGVIRDILAAGGGAKPVAATDVFCFAPLDIPPDALPEGVLHPRRVMNGVVAGVRDYSNRLGVPTVSGAIYFDERYLGNPLVFCGCVGILPADKLREAPKSGDLIVLVGGRTGRDGIHGATFSSAELGADSHSRSGGAVQIGNPITEKMLLDVLLSARDRGLYRSISDCGAGGLSSAIGELAKNTGAVVRLDQVPLKYAGLTYTEIWISESQERMILAVPPAKWGEMKKLCESEGVEATAIGDFRSDARLQLLYRDERVAELTMDFLHDGRPSLVRDAVYAIPNQEPLRSKSKNLDCNAALVKILGSPNVSSRESIIRQYDHEVQSASVVRPLVGRHNDGPSDAAVLRPVHNSKRGLVVACGMNPRYADFDTYHMAASAIDEAVRNCVAVGADPNRIALVDNFCWGDCQKPKTLGSLVRAAQACHDIALALGTPFVSGKDSLNNEFRFGEGERCIAIPPSLLISALGQVDDVNRCVTMDLKQPGNVLYQVGCTRCELGGSHLALVENLTGGTAPQVDCARAKATFIALHKAIQAGLVCACHDLSEGGLAVGTAEMALAGGLGARLYLIETPHVINAEEAAAVPGGLATALLFAESNSRFLVEVCEDAVGHFEEILGDVPHAGVGEVTELARLVVSGIDPMAELHVIDIDVTILKQAWQKPSRS